MSKTEERGDASPAEEVCVAVTGFVTDFKGFQAEIETKLQQTEERMTMLDRKMTLPARTPLGGATDAGVPHQKAFNALFKHLTHSIRQALAEGVSPLRSFIRAVDLEASLCDGLFRTGNQCASDARACLTRPKTLALRFSRSCAGEKKDGGTGP